MDRIDEERPLLVFDEEGEEEVGCIEDEDEAMGGPAP